MKKIIISLFCFSILFTSCEDYLETNSLSEFDRDFVFSSPSHARKMLLGVYSLFGEDPYTSRMSNVWMQNTDVEAIAPSVNPDGSRRDIWSLQGGLLTGFGDIYKAWQNNYLAIDRANQCIEGIQSSSLANDPEMQHLLGEAYCLKAYRYFLLCNFWGDVPYYDYAAKKGLALDVPKTDKNIIYSQCIQDLVNVEGQMKLAENLDGGIEYMNREFALGMIARLALFRAGYGMTKEIGMKRADDYLDVANNDSLAVMYTSAEGVDKVARTSQEYYQLASDYCEKLMDISDRDLESDFSQVFTNQSQLNTVVGGDVLYEVAFLAQYGGDVGWCVGQIARSTPKGSTTIQVNLTPSYYFSFDDKDTRKYATVALAEFEGDSLKMGNITGLATQKWSRMELPTDPGSESSKGTGINWPLMRYSDVLLMYAEAQNEINNGPTADAIEALKRVRRRAFSAEAHAEKVDNYLTGLSSKEAFFNAIVDERAWEFGGEGIRKFDLVRWNNYGQKIVEAKRVIDLIGIASRIEEDRMEEVVANNPEATEYTKFANYVYYRATKKEGLIVLNSTYEPVEEPEYVDVEELTFEGNENKYARTDWGRKLWQNEVDEKTGVVTNESANYTQRCWRGYVDPTGTSAVPYLLPISITTIGASDYLNNDGYGHVFTY